jgi:MFS family permease
MKPVAMNDDDYPYRSPPVAKAWPPQSSPVQLAADTCPPAGVSLVGIFVAVFAIASIGNVTVVPVADYVSPSKPGFILGITYMCAVAGSIGAQAALLAILLVWGPGALWQRQAWHWGLVAALFTAWGCGFAIAESNWVLSRRFPSRELLTTILGLPLVSLACQAGPWLFRIYLHWRIERPGEAREPASPETLSIRDFLLGTILVALTMAAVRLGKPMNVSAAWYWAAWGIGSAAAASISLLCVLPFLYLTLGVRNIRWGAVGIAAIAASVASTAISILVWFNRINGGFGPNDKEIALIFSALAFGFTATLAGALWIARAYGYRLVMNRPRMPSFGPAGKEP